MGAVLLLTCATAFSASAPDPVYSALRQAGIAETLLVENVVLQRDAGVLTLKSGTIGFTAPAMGRDTEAVFVGEGEFTLTPVTPIERNYVRSITGTNVIREPFDRALFCFTDDAGKQIRAQAKAGPNEPKLGDALRDFRKALRSRPDTARSSVEEMLTSESMDNIEADLLADLYNPAQAGFFNAYIHGRKNADLRFFLRPRGALPFLPAPEEVALIDYDPETGAGGIVYLSHLKSEVSAGTAISTEDKRAVQAESYKIETTIAGNDHVTAAAEFHFKAVRAGERIVKFGLLPNLRVASVKAGGQDVPFIQEDRKADGSFYVVMPQAMAAGSEHALNIEYQGDKVLRKAGSGNFYVGARTSWYPSVNSFLDRARYDLTFKYPKGYTLVGVGKLAREWKEKDYLCSQWVSEIPLAVAGFNLAEYEKKQVGEVKTSVAVEGYATAHAPDYVISAGGTDFSPVTMNRQIISQAQAAVQVYELYFGKSEFERLAITQQSAFDYGQSWPTLVYLPLSAYLDSTERWQLVGLQTSLTRFVNEVTAHEVAHQWWGHMVGNATYHDVWLSEGFATFSAGLYLLETEKTNDKYLDYWKTARDRLLAKNEFGHQPNDAGPLWLGQRLDSARNPGGYRYTNYEKGGYVLHMLQQLMYDPKEGSKYFAEMMQDFVRQFMNRNATTEDFQHVVEQHMRPGMDLARNGKLDWFFSEWVYGTAVPRYKLDYEVAEQPGGKWLLKGSIAQSEVGPEFLMAVPVYADFDGQLVRLGAAGIAGNSSAAINVLLPKKPKRVLVNARHDVLEQP
jgi:hypothetical protein